LEDISELSFHDVRSPFHSKTAQHSSRMTELEREPCRSSTPALLTQQLDQDFVH